MEKGDVKEIIQYCQYHKNKLKILSMIPRVREGCTPGYINPFSLTCFV